MPVKQKKRYHVLQRSHINGNIHEAGSIVDIEVDDHWQAGPNLREIILSEEELEAKHEHERAQLRARHDAERAQLEAMKPKNPNVGK